MYNMAMKELYLNSSVALVKANVYILRMIQENLINLIFNVTHAAKIPLT